MDPIPKDVSDPTYRSRSLILTAWPPDPRAIPLASNPEFHTATKHIAIRFHRLREEVAAGSVCFVKIPTAQMAADGMTKPLAMEIMFRRWIAQIGLHLGARVCHQCRTKDKDEDRKPFPSDRTYFYGPGNDMRPGEVPSHLPILT